MSCFWGEQGDIAKLHWHIAFKISLWQSPTQMDCTFNVCIKSIHPNFTQSCSRTGSLALSVHEEILLGSNPGSHSLSTKGTVQFNLKEHLASQSFSSLSPASPVMEVLGYTFRV